MKSIFLTAIVAALALLATAVWLLAAPPFAPEQGLLLLKNGQVMEGGILREGDRYVITLGRRGEKGELKIPAVDVDAVCRDLRGAYEHKRSQIRQRAAKSHLDLADWCLRQGLHDEAANELVTAAAIDPRDPQIAPLERRLKLALHPPAEKVRPIYALPPSQEEIEAAIKTLSPEAIEQFTSQVQPLLLSRCAATGCHGPNSTAEYHLVRPPLRHANKLRETQRNLHATLAQISATGESPLLVQALAPHAAQKTPPLGERDQRQIELLTEWVQSARGSAREVSRTGQDANVKQASFVEEGPPRDALPPGTRRLPGTEPSAFVPEPAAKPLKNEGPAARDPFDPRPFNEKYHPEK